MNKLIVLAVAVLASSAWAQDDNKEDRLPTHEELVQSFTESFKRARENAKEYSNFSEEREKQIIADNTVTPAQIQETAAFTVWSLSRQVRTCEVLLKKYPKSKGAKCTTAVLMVNGLGHADQQKQIMEIFNNDEKLKAASVAFADNNMKRQLDYSERILKAGIGGKIDTRDRRLEMQDVESALGLLSSYTTTKQMLKEALFESNIPLNIGKDAEVLFKGMTERPDFTPEKYEVLSENSRQVRIECVYDNSPGKGHTCFRAEMWLYGKVAKELFKALGTPRNVGGVPYTTGIVKCDRDGTKYKCLVTRQNN